MSKFTPAFLLFLYAAAVSIQVQAAEDEPFLDGNLFALGGGISFNEADGDDELGFQVFGAYDLPQVVLTEGIDSSIEFGFMDFGTDEDDTGIWVSYVIDGAINDQFGWLAQGGWDFGDDKGLLFGAGIKYRLDQATDIRVEYIVRDETDSLQANIQYHF